MSTHNENRKGAWTARRSIARKTGRDISRADFVFCMTAITWGWDAADRLMEESTKAQKNGKGYAELTARNAALAAGRRPQRLISATRVT